MTLDSLHRWMKRQGRAAGMASRGRARPSWKPSLESLEAREVPATLVLPQTDVPSFSATLDGRSYHLIAGGNFLGTLDSHGTLIASYCVNLERSIYLTTYPNAAVTYDGTIDGVAVPHADAISWLLIHFGPAATTPEEQDALQAAIWRTEYGDRFELDSVDNDNAADAENFTVGPIYKADLAALGTNTAPVEQISWITPGENPDHSAGQGLAALNPNAQYVAAAYQDLLHRPADEGGQAYWTNLLDQGTPRSAVA